MRIVSPLKIPFHALTTSRSQMSLTFTLDGLHAVAKGSTSSSTAHPNTTQHKSSCIRLPNGSDQSILPQTQTATMPVNRNRVFYFTGCKSLFYGACCSGLRSLQLLN